MFVRVKLYDTLRRLSNTSDRGIWEGEVPQNCIISELIQIIGTKEGEVACAAIDKKVVPLDTVIQEGDQVMLVTNINGG
jgi:sulfur carrier protein ThiS